MGKESALDKVVIARAKARGGMAIKMHGSAFQSGVPDILIGYKGRLVFLENKAPTGRLRPGQRLTLLAARKAGCIAEVCFGADLVDEIFDAIDADEDWVPRSKL